MQCRWATPFLFKSTPSPPCPNLFSRSDSSSYQGVSKRCLRREADVYLINIDGNDITTTSGPEDSVDRIVKLVDQLYRRRRVKMVYVAEIQTRGDFRGGLTKQEFDDRRLIINDLLRERYHQYYVQFTNGLRHRPSYLDSTERHRNSRMRKHQSRIKRIFCSYRPHRRC